MADIQIGSFRGYSNSSTSHGYYLIYFGYDSVSRGADSVTFNNARVWGQQQGTGYTTNTIYLDQFAINNINMNTSWSGKGSTNSSWSAGWKNMTVTGINAGTTGVTAQFWMHRDGQSWGAQSGSGNVPISKASIWNDINAFKPDGSTQNGLIFDLSTSDGSKWTNLTNEPDGFTKVYGTTATISNIRSNVTGAHYTSNNVTGNGASSFTWTFTTANWACALYSAWNTYTIAYNANGGSGAPSSQTKTYGTNLALSSTKPTRTGYTFLGWSTSSSATSASYSAGATLSSDLSTTNGATVTLYAVWKANAPYSLSLSGTGNTTSSISLKLAASSAISITNYTVYYKTGSTTTYSSKSFGTSTTGSITGLSADTNYTIYFTATNATGTTTSGTITYSTLLNNPTISTPIVSDLLPFSCTISATGSISPSRTLTYEFSKDNGATWNKYNLFDWNAVGFTPLGATATISDITGGKKVTINSITATSGSAGFYFSLSTALWNSMATGDKYTFSFTLKSSSSNSFSQSFGTNWEASSSTIRVPEGDHTYATAKDKYMICTCNKSASYRAITFYTPYTNLKAGDTFEITNFMITKSNEKLPYADYNSSKYYWTGLNEETAYQMKVRVTATHISQNATDTMTTSSALEVTTPADQAKIRIKKDGTWQKGKAYYKKDGTWVKAKKIYIKVDGKWKINNNYDS